MKLIVQPSRIAGYWRFLPQALAILGRAQSNALLEDMPQVVGSDIQVSGKVLQVDGLVESAVDHGLQRNGMIRMMHFPGIVDDLL